MTDDEFDVMDELYFLQSFEELKEQVDIEGEKLKEILRNLLSKGWVKCFESATESLAIDIIDFESNFDKYHYLATKEGLLAHNSV